MIVRALAAAFAFGVLTSAPGQAGLFSTTPQMVGAVDLARIHKIGVVSVLDSKIHFTTMGTMVFSNSSGDLDASSWALNDTANKAAQSVLDGHFSVSALMPAFDLFADEHYWQGHTGDDYAKMLIDKMSGAGVDAYLLIQPHQARDELGGTNALLDGLGVYRHNFLDRHAAYEHEFFRIALIDAKTGKYLAVSAPCVQGCDAEPARSFDDTGWPDDPASLSPDQTARLRSDFIGMVDSGLSLGLKKMFGTP